MLDGPWVQFAQFLLNIFILAGVGIWRLAQVERDISLRFDKTFDEYRQKALSDMTNLKENQNEIERWVLEQFVRREDMKAAIDQINVSLSDIRQRLDTRMDRIETKIDNLGSKRA